MAKIHITFQEEGNDPVIIVLPESVSNAINQNLDYLRENGVNFEGKAQYFAHQTWNLWLKAICERYNAIPETNSLQEIKQQKEVLEQQYRQVKELEERVKLTTVIQFSVNQRETS